LADIRGWHESENVKNTILAEAPSASTKPRTPQSLKRLASRAEAPIGVFDSGLGGLTVVRELRRRLPHERVVYFGDIARLPYGIKSEKQIREFSCENTEFLLKCKVKAIVVACNSSSSAAYSYLKKNYSVPIIDVIQPAAEKAVSLNRNHKIGVIATQATVASKAYEAAIWSIDKKVKVFSQACPLLVPFVEEGVLEGKLIEMVLTRYLNPILEHKIDTLILGCTHYPLLKRVIQKVVGPKVKLIDSAPAAVGKLKSLLIQTNGSRSEKKKGDLQVFVSDLPNTFRSVGARFLGENLNHVKVVRFQAKVTVNGKWTL